MSSDHHVRLIELISSQNNQCVDSRGHKRTVNSVSLNAIRTDEYTCDKQDKNQAQHVVLVHNNVYPHERIVLPRTSQIQVEYQLVSEKRRCRYQIALNRQLSLTFNSVRSSIYTYHLYCNYF